MNQFADLPSDKNNRLADLKNIVSLDLSANRLVKLTGVETLVNLEVIVV